MKKVILFDLGGVSASFDLEYSPNVAADGTGEAIGDGGSATVNEGMGGASGAGVTLSYDALKFGIYGAEIDRTTPGTNAQNDVFEGAWYVNYSFGPVSIGYTESYMDGGANGTAEAVTAAKQLTSETGTSWHVIKAQVHAGGRGKGGGVKLAKNLKEVEEKYGMLNPQKEQRGMYAPSPMKVSPDANLFPGFKEALAKLRVGDKAFFHFPSHLAYAEAGRPPVVKPNTDLAFIIEMVDIMK